MDFTIVQWNYGYKTMIWKFAQQRRKQNLFPSFQVYDCIIKDMYNDKLDNIVY